MPSASRSARIDHRDFRRPLLLVVALAGGLSMLIALAPASGLPLAALALGCGLVVLVTVASAELERDVVWMSSGCALVGAFGESWLRGSSYLWHGVLFGAIVGALAGDEIQLSQRWLRLVRHTKEEARWWQKLPLESRWLPRAVWLGLALVMTGAVVLVVAAASQGLPHAGRSQLLRDLLVQFREVRMESSVLRNLGYAWFAVVPLAMSIALSNFATRMPRQALLQDGLLRRVGVLQCAALLMLAVDALASWVFSLSQLSAHTPRDYYLHFVGELAFSLHIAIVPALLVVAAQLFLRQRLLFYWQRSGWLLALGILGLTLSYALGFLLAYLMGVIT